MAPPMQICQARLVILSVPFLTLICYALCSPHFFLLRSGSVSVNECMQVLVCASFHHPIYFHQSGGQVALHTLSKCAQSDVGVCRHAQIFTGPFSAPQSVRHIALHHYVTRSRHVQYTPPRGTDHTAIPLLQSYPIVSCTLKHVFRFVYTFPLVSSELNALRLLK